MASVRNTSDNVKEIFSVTELTDSQIQRFLDTANLIIFYNLVETESNLEEEELDEIELYLAAHLCALKEPRASQEKFDILSVSYQGKTGLYLDSTHYGQTVQMLDRSGRLNKIGETSGPMLFEAL